jgi:hypothetical protein
MFPDTGTWFVVRRGHLVVGRGRRSLWRSHGEVASKYQIGVVMASAQMVAFQHDHKLYVAQLGTAERPVANREMPLGWTSGGLYTYRYHGRQLLVRSDAGRLLRVLARRPLGSDYFVANGSLYFVSRGALIRAHGARAQQLASLERLGFSSGSLSIQPLGRLVELEDDNRLVVLRADGSLFAWTPLPRTHGQPDSTSSSLVVASDASSVAFTAASDQTGNPDPAPREQGTETVYLLRAGAHRAIPVHREQVAFAPCERGASVAWHGSWLLYSAHEGNLAAIETAGIPRAIELTSRVRSLPGMRNGFSAYWSGRTASS